MKTDPPFLKCETLPIILVGGSVIPALLLGYIMDFALVHLYAHYQGMALPRITVPVYKTLAGYRGLAQEMMLACWLGMVVWFVKQARAYTASEPFRTRFLMGFALIWLVMLTIFLAVLSACLAPSDMLLDRIDGYGGYLILHGIVALELVAVFVLAFKAFLDKKKRGT